MHLCQFIPGFTKANNLKSVTLLFRSKKQIGGAVRASDFPLSGYQMGDLREGTLGHGHPMCHRLQPSKRLGLHA